MPEESLGRGHLRWWLVGVAVIVVVVAAWFLAAGLLGGPTTPAAAPTPAVPSGQPTTQVPSPSVAPPTRTGPPTVEPTKKPSTIRTGLQGSAEMARGVTASVLRVESVTGEAHGPGEIAGPSLRVTIRVQNATDAAVPLSLGLINVYYGKDRTPASTVSGPGVVAFPATVAPRATATGTAVFNVPKDQRGHVEVEFSYSTDAALVIFSGAV